VAFDIRKDKSLKEETGIFDDDFFMEDEVSESIDWNMDTKDVFLIVFKLFSLALGILVMMYFEKQNIEKLNAKRASIQKELNGMQSQKSNMETEIKSFSDLDNKSQEFMQQLEVIQVLAKKRLQAISVLDMIQTAIPEKVWLKKIAYKDREFSSEGTALTNT